MLEASSEGDKYIYIGFAFLFSILLSSYIRSIASINSLYIVVHRLYISEK